MNQAPTEESNSYIGRIKTVQFIYIFKKVGLINQTPTRIKSRQEVILYINKVGLMNQAPTKYEL